MSNDLIERREAVTADQQREVLTAVGEHWASREWWDYDTQARFWKMLDAEAYESAALTLVPEGYSTELGIYVEAPAYYGPEPGFCARVSQYCMGDGPGWERDVCAPTPALAICIAALKAKESSNG